MRLVTTPRVTFLRALADEIVAQYGHGRMIVAIDGPLRSGKSQFGDDLADVLRERDHSVFRASIEDFHRSRAAQADFGADTPARYFGYGIDESALRRVLVEPFRMGGSTAFVTQGVRSRSRFLGRAEVDHRPRGRHPRRRREVRASRAARRRCGTCASRSTATRSTRQTSSPTPNAIRASSRQRSSTSPIRHTPDDGCSKLGDRRRDRLVEHGGREPRHPNRQTGTSASTRS